jgi:hypothetical protein
MKAFLKYSSRMCTLAVICIMCALSASASWSADADNRSRQWKAGPIKIAISRSLGPEAVNIKANSDVVGALRNSLRAWSEIADIDFATGETDAESVSPHGNAGDGVSVITSSASTANILLFGRSPFGIPAATRLFFDREGFIIEADIVLNPLEQFSTDGTFGTYDLEAVFVHEIGHLLGIPHSQVIGSSMFRVIGRNGLYGLPGVSGRTLSADDIAMARAKYGVRDSMLGECCGSVEGRLTVEDNLRTSKSVVWAEHLIIGSITASTVPDVNGRFALEGLSTGEYRIMAGNGGTAGILTNAQEIGIVKVESGSSQIIGGELNGDRPSAGWELLGFNGQLSDAAVFVNAGRSYRVYVGAAGERARPVSIDFNSKFISSDPDTLIRHDYGRSFSVYSFEVTFDTETPVGTYGFAIVNADRSESWFIGGIAVESFANNLGSIVSPRD